MIAPHLEPNNGLEHGNKCQESKRAREGYIKDYLLPQNPIIKTHN
jgi:hypothetical protein